MRIIRRIIISCMLITLSTSPLHAATEVTFSGTLIEPPPCQVNNDQIIDVPFNKISVNAVDGVQHRQIVGYTLECIASADRAITLTLIGEPALFERATVLTNVSGLGIKVYQDDKEFELDKPITIDPKSPPILAAVPVKKLGTVLKGGAFKATATLRTDYQ